MAGLSLKELMQAAGASLGDAQTQLTQGVDTPPTKMALSDATIEMKVAVDGAKGSDFRVAPVSSEDTRSGAINVGALSTVTMRFVAFAADAPAPVASPPPPPAGGGTRPVISADEAIKQVADRTDLRVLARAIGPLTFDAILVPEKQVWLVSVADQAGADVRPVIAVPAIKD